MKFSILYTLVFLFCLGASALSANDTTWNAKGRYGFIENKGQIIDQNNKLNKSVLFLLPGQQSNIQLRKDGFSYDVYTEELFEVPSSSLTDEPEDSSFFHFHRIDIKWIKSNKKISVIPFEKSKSFRNYYTTGTGKDGVKDVRHYQKVVYKNVWNFIDVEFLITEKGPKFNYIVHPGGDLQDIKWRYNGANSNRLENETILLESNMGNITEHIPYSYLKENLAGVNVEYTKQGDIYGFKPMATNGKTLVIDPVPSLIWSSFWGWGTATWVRGKLSGSHIVYFGNTNNSNNLATAGAYQSTIAGDDECIIGKYTKDRVVQWTTFVGGIGEDKLGYYKEYDNKWFFLGNTKSNDFPTTTGKYQTSYGGYTDGFIFQLIPSGSLIWSSFIGGSKGDLPRDFTFLDDKLYITGITESYNAIATVGAYKSTKLNYGGFFDDDGFVMKLDTGMTTKFWGTYLGGNSTSGLSYVAVDTNENVYVAGMSEATNMATTNAYMPVKPIPTSISSPIIIKFNSLGNRIWGSYYGDGSTYHIKMYQFEPNKILIGHHASSAYSSNVCNTTPWNWSYAMFVDQIDSSGIPTTLFKLPKSSQQGAPSRLEFHNGNYYIYDATETNYSGLYNGYQNAKTASTCGYVAKFVNHQFSWLTYIGYNSLTGLLNLSVRNDTLLVTLIAATTSFPTTDTILGSITSMPFGGLISMLFRDSCNDLTLANYGAINGLSAVCPYDTVYFNINPQLYTEHYEWGVPAGATLISGQGSPCAVVVFDTTSGNVTVTPRNSCDTATTISFAVHVNSPPAQPQISPSDTLYICPNDSFFLSSNTNQNIVWSTGDTTSNITISQAGKYTLTHLDTSNCASNTLDSLWVLWSVTPDTPSVSPSGTIRLCMGDSVQLTTPVSNQYYWSTGDSTQNIWVKQAGSYTLQINDSLLCWSFSSDTVQVIVDQPLSKPIISPTDTITFCQGDSALVFAQGTGSMIWNTGTIGSSLSVNSSGSYFVYSTDSLSCPNVYSDTVWANVIALPSTPSIFLAGNDTICLGDSVLISSVSGQALNWSNGDSTVSFWVKQSGSYYGLEKNTLQCFSDTSNTITVYVDIPLTKPSLTALGSLIFCDGDSTLLQVNSLHPTLWNTGDTSSQLWVKTAGVYFVQTKANTVCNQINSDTLTINVLPKPNMPSITPTDTSTLCSGEGVFLNSSSMFYNRWSTGDTTQQIYVQTPGLVYLWLEDSFGCVGDSAQIEVLPSSLSLGNDTTVCAGTVLQLQATGGSNYQWSIGATSASIVIIVNAAQQVWVHDVISGCYDTLKIDILPKPQAQFTMTPSNGFTPLDVQFTNQSIGATSYSWDFGDGNQTTATDPMHTYNNSGDYTVTLIAENSQGCADTSTYSFIEVEGGGFIYIPNTFTPNGDGRNEFFEIFGVEKPFTLMVYNRWGNQIFYNADYQNNWDGTVQGQAIPQGAYSYLIEYKYINPNATSTNPEGSTRVIRGVVNVVN